MKLLILTSALDLRLSYGCTSAWWFLFKALYEMDVDLLVTVYQGRTVPSPWWTSYENPCYWEGYTFGGLKTIKSQLSRQSYTGENSKRIRNFQDHLILQIAWAFIRPRWRGHILNILQKAQGVDAVLFINVPFNQLRGIPLLIREKYHIPVIGYDPDMPVSLPKYQGFATGFRIYNNADLREFDLFIGNSKGGIEELKLMGAKDAKFLGWAVDPDIVKPVAVSEQDIDVFFYGYGDEYRQEWMKTMLVDPSTQWPERNIYVRGSGFKINLGKVRSIKDIPYNRLRELCCRSKINTNIGRASHTRVYASSSMRPFELAAMECCMVSNPYSGLEEWFVPGQEMFMLSQPEEVLELYPWLWSHEEQRSQTGKMARARVLKDHTYKHRARELVQMIWELIG
jgi:hypothetical protein